MNRFALLALYRSITRHRLYAAINIGGLAVGIAVFMVLGLYVRFQTSFETWLPHHDEIYLVQSVFGGPGPLRGPMSGSMGGLLEELDEDFPGLVGTRLLQRGHGFSVVRDGELVQEDLAQVDPSFFQVFDLPMSLGVGGDALADPASVLISESTARKYFGAGNPLGRTMTIIFDRPQPRRVVGVFKDLPKNSDLKLSILARLPDMRDRDDWYNWRAMALPTFVRFATPAQARAFEQKLPAIVERRGARDLGLHASKAFSLHLQPLTRGHLQPGGVEKTTLRQTVETLALVGLLTLLIAVVNYVNLATARSGFRAREVAVRKVLGARRATVVAQFIVEASATVAIAVLVGFALAELGLPFVNAASGLSLTMPYAFAVPAAVLLAMIVGLSAGLYPALIMSCFPAATVLASAQAPGGGRAGAMVRDVLVLLQFALAIAFIIGTFVLVAQMRHVRQADLGFQRGGLLIVPMNDSNIGAGRTRVFLDQLSALPSVAVAGVGSETAGGGGGEFFANIQLPGVAGGGPQLLGFGVGPGFFDSYGVKPIAGRLFEGRHGGDDGSRPDTPGVPLNIVINRTAVSTLGFRAPQDAIGKTVGGATPRTIIGVVPDLRFFSPREPTYPTFYRYYPDLSFDPIASVRFTGDPRAIMAATRSLWRRTFPLSPFTGEFADRRLEKLYEDDDRATRLFSIGAVLAVLIGCVGLWGLASFNTSRRVKEIGIRKTLGASSNDIVRLLVGQFLRPVLTANLIAWPLAYFALRKWLAGFDDRIALSPLYFVAGSALALLIALATVIVQSLHAARAAPAWALRRE